MKNTAKKILALVFAVAMICTLAVPAFAADETIKIRVAVVDNENTVLFDEYVAIDVEDANIEAALDDYTYKTSAGKTIDFDISGGKIGNVNDIDVEGPFNTDGWVVALNGKIVTSDLATVSLEKYDVVTVYWADTTLETKLAVVDDSLITSGIISFHYYDAEGVKQPLVGATVTIANVANALVETGAVGTTTANGVFTTDEKGQIWIAPQYLDGGDKVVFDILSLELNEDDKIVKIDDDDKNYTTAEKTYYNACVDNGMDFIAAVAVNTDVVLTADAYNTGATGDMTMVYVLVAVAAVVTLGAVVVMKKKSAKAQ